MEDGLITADAVADFETRLKITLPATYVGIPKSVFACLAIRHTGNRQDGDVELLALMESVLLALTKDEASAIAHGSQLPSSRCAEIARTLSLSIESVNTAIDRFWFFWNEGLILTDTKTRKR